MRKELSNAVAAVFDAPLSDPGLDFNDEARLVALSTFAVRCRSAVERDNHLREIQLVPDPEAPGRLTRVLRGLLVGMEAVGVVPAAAWRVVVKVGLDSMPVLRRKVVATLASASEAMATTAVSEAIAHPRNTVGRVLEDLYVHRVLSRASCGPGTSDLWELSPWARARWEIISFPEMSEPDGPAPSE